MQRHFLNYKSKKNKERQQNLQRENMNLDKQREQEAIKLKSDLLHSEKELNLMRKLEFMKLRKRLMKNIFT